MDTELNKENLLKLYPPYTSVLGPYKRPDNRMHVVLNNSNVAAGVKGKTKTISYPKALVESTTGVRLLDNETVDHDDRIFSNNEHDNLVIRDRSAHASLDALRVCYEKVMCADCGTVFMPSKDQVHDRSTIKAGPFCSRLCSGRYGKRVQLTGKVKEKTPVDKHYYRVNKSKNA